MTVFVLKLISSVITHKHQATNSANLMLTLMEHSGYLQHLLPGDVIRMRIYKT